MNGKRLLRLIVLSATLVLGTPPLAAGTDQPDETLPGFKAQHVYQAGGVDHVNLFSGDVGIVIPLGPEYPLSAGLSWQLRAAYSSKIWTFDSIELPTGSERRYAYVAGFPTLGVGWGLHLGYVDDVTFVSPAAGRHIFSSTSGSAVSSDASALRRTGDITTGFTVEVPDGSKQTFGKKFFRPRPSPELSPPTHDFSDDTYSADRPRWGLTSITDRFGKRVLTVEYLDALTGQAADAWKVWRVHLTPPPDFSGVERVIVWNWTTWTNYKGQVWPVLASIQFPAANGTLTVSFERTADLLDSSFVRSSYDTAHLPDPASPGYIPTDGTVWAPQLTAIRMSGADGQGGSAELAAYFFQYNGTVAGNTVANGLLKELTLPTGGRVSYTYTLTAGGGMLPADLEREGCPAAATLQAVPSDPDPKGPAVKFAKFLDASAAVATRTEKVAGLPDSVTSWCRRQAAPTLATGGHDVSRVVRQVVATRPDGNGGSVATKHLFSVEVLHNDGDPSNAGLELERRYYAGTDVTVPPIRTLVFCYEADGPGYTQGCGYRTRDGSNSYVPGVLNVRRQKEVTWYGVNPTGGGDCTDATSPACWQKAYLGWNGFAYEYATERISSNSTFLMYDDTTGGPVTSRYRDLTTDWAPSIAPTVWLPKLYSAKTTADNFAGGCPWWPCSVRTDYDFDRGNGFLRSTWTADGSYGTLTEAFAPDAAGNPATRTVSGSWAGAGSFVTRHTFLHGLPLTSSRDGISGWSQFDVTRDTATGLIVASRDPNGLTTSYGYDALGRLTRVTPPGGEAATTYCYQPWNASTNPAAYVLAKKGAALPCRTNDGTPGEGTGSFEAYVFDGSGRLVRELRRSPNALSGGGWFSFRETRYNNAGYAAFAGEWAACPGGTDASSCFAAAAPTGTDSSNFDFLGRARTITSADGNVTTRSFDDPSGIPNSDFTELVTIWNVGGKAAYSGTRKDILGRALIVTTPGPPPFGPYACQSYNTLDKPVKVNVGCGDQQNRTFVWDALGFLRSETHPEKGTKTYLEYDALGNATKSREGGFNYRSTYDALGRLLALKADALTYPSDEPTTVYTENSWDGSAGPSTGAPKGRLTRQVGWNPATADKYSVLEDFTYAGLGGRMSAHETTTRNSSNQTVLRAAETYAYNGLGLLESYGHPRVSGSFLATTTYVSGRPVKVSAAGTSVVNPATYNAAGQLASYKTGNGVTTTIEVDTSGMARPRRIGSAGALQNWTTGVFSYDGAGNITGMGSDTFNYDYRSRLTKAAFGSIAGAPNETFTYDDFGNMTQRSWSGTGGGTVLHDTLPASNRLTGASYDSLGNVTLFGTERYLHDALSRRWRYSGGGTSEEYSYDGSGERLVRKAISLRSNTYTFNLRDEENRTRTDYKYDSYRGTTILLADYLYLGNLQVATYTTTVSGTLPVGWVYYSNDHLGSPRLVTDPSRNVLATYRYRAFGLPMSTSATPGQGTDFASMERDTSSGHHYDHARFYGGWLGRFTSPDQLRGSLSDPQSWNRYAYARNNPLKYLDPNGQDGVNAAEWLNTVATAIADWGGTHDGEHYSSYVDVANTLNRVGDWLRVGSSIGEAIGSGADFHDAGIAFATDLGRASEMALALGTVAEMGVGGSTQPQRSPTVQENKAKGDAFRDKVAADLRAQGREVATEVQKSTPFGPRTVDVEVRENGKARGGIETKTGRSRYTPSQRAKDEYLRRVGYPVTVVRD
ncbi:MAG TPA: RHS repeat-associated core domain-containing protein [Thermoanaerobaculia bacterium]|nr:RHS repeat-associated core domain-containing protein [Thermoanaerobaculia bacterium]HQR66342.1 RHS repeat-associated core domain-containing protein [Thermoanaerobaculia bacterium]